MSELPELAAVRFEVDDHVATVWLHRPHRHNAWTGRMHREYRAVMAHLDAQPEVRVVVVTGTPPAFCVGGDRQALADHAQRGSYDAGLDGEVPLARPGYGVRAEFDHDFAFQFAMRFPIIAAVNGAAAGVGLALALFCDLRFASASARCTTAAPKLGLPAEYGMSWMLPRLTGVARATDLLLSGRVFTPGETAEWGLWNGVAADGEATMTMALDYAWSLATTAGPTAVRITKRQIYDDLLRHDVGASIDDAQRLLDQQTGTAEYREGVAALREKRVPNF
jgi:enoyl-CoA hydratase/carnithine racemase